MYLQMFIVKPTNQLVTKSKFYSESEKLEFNPLGK